MKSKEKYTDENGYLRFKDSGKLVHRFIAYTNIYKKNKTNYPGGFSKYQVHHKNLEKKDNRISNLQILTPEEHMVVHGISEVIPLTTNEVLILIGLAIVWIATGSIIIAGSTFLILYGLWNLLKYFKNRNK